MVVLFDHEYLNDLQLSFLSIGLGLWEPQLDIPIKIPLRFFFFFLISSESHETLAHVDTVVKQEDAEVDMKVSYLADDSCCSCHISCHSASFLSPCPCRVCRDKPHSFQVNTFCTVCGKMSRQDSSFCEACRKTMQFPSHPSEGSIVVTESSRSDRAGV